MSTIDTKPTAAATPTLKPATLTPSDRQRKAKSLASTGKLVRTSVLHLFLAGATFTMAVPFVWMVLTSMSLPEEVGRENWIPALLRSGDWNMIKEHVFDNYKQVFKEIEFGRFYCNSIFIASWVTFLQVFTSSLAAFAFSRLKWPGRDRIFLMYLSTMMLPGLVMMIPNFQIMIKLGWIDTFAGLIIPSSFSAFGTFLLRQFMLTIPSSLDEAAEIDGASKWQVYWNVILPLSRPGLITLTIFTFMGSYMSFFWPLVMLKSVHRYTLPIGLLFFDSTQGQSTHLLMAAVAMSIVPMIVVFVLLQKRLVKGIQLGAVKG